jgi:uncharacterized protein (DUF1330 family)
MAATPAFLFVELPAAHANQVHVLEDAARLLGAAGAEVLAYAAPGRVSCLEPATVAAGMLIARVGDAARATAIANDRLLPALRRVLPSDFEPTVLQVVGLPEKGLPEMMAIPTVASVPAAPRVPRNALMVIRGSVTNQSQLDKYRDVILPMLKERNGYYEVFAVSAGEVVALSGRWNDQIFAISRWPTRAAAEDFWYCDQYQQTAIPLRVGYGHFAVHLLDAAL